MALQKQRELSQVRNPKYSKGFNEEILIHYNCYQIINSDTRLGMSSSPRVFPTARRTEKPSQDFFMWMKFFQMLLANLSRRCKTMWNIFAFRREIFVQYAFQWLLDPPVLSLPHRVVWDALAGPQRRWVTVHSWLAQWQTGCGLWWVLPLSGASTQHCSLLHLTNINISSSFMKPVTKSTDHTRAISPPQLLALQDAFWCPRTQELRGICCRFSLHSANFRADLK